MTLPSRWARRSGWLGLSLLVANFNGGQAAAATLTVSHTFTGAADGAVPGAGVTQDSQGNVYGENLSGADLCPAPNGDTFGCGVVYKIDPAGNFTTLVTFNGSNGSYGASPLTLVGTRLFGSASQATAPSMGVIFSVNTDGSNFKVLHSFTGLDGATPWKALQVMPNGTIYGVTMGGGPNYVVGGPGGSGVLFELAPDGTYIILHAFTGVIADDGFEPGTIVVAPNGTIYGGTHGIGGASGGGTIYSYVPSTRVFTTVKRLNSAANGITPELGGMSGSSALYGVTLSGPGLRNPGSLFQFSKSGGFQTLYAFTGGADGGYPEAAPVGAAGGGFIGTTTQDGTGGGTIYKFSKGVLTTLYNFNSTGPAGTPWKPAGGLTLGASGALLGTTQNDGPTFQPVSCPTTPSSSPNPFGCGTVFSFSP